MGVVYHAVDRQTGEEVALKTLRHVDAQSIYRLKQEFRALSDLVHENLLRFRELCCEGDHWFFTMELVEGQSFLEHVGSPCDEERLRAALGQLVDGVRALHDAGRVHRDIKPANVCITAEGRVVLLDFGLAIELSLAQSDAVRDVSDDNIVGTVAYMAPEQAAGMPPGPEADWYSVGVMLFEALTGKLPFTGAAMEIMMDKVRLDPPRPSHIAASVPPDLDALCADLLAFDPRARPSGAAIAQRLGFEDPATTRSTIKRRPFVAREAELAALEQAVDDARRGHAVTVMVTGESGIGKSVLVRRFLERLGDRAVVLRGRCYQRESVPFRAFDAVVDDLSRYLSNLDQVDAALILPRDVALLARLFPVLKRVPAVARARARGGPAGVVEQRGRAFAALRELLAALAERQPLVLFIDDLQWADADSLALFEDVMHGPEVAPVLLIAAIRSEGAVRRLEATPSLPRPSLVPSLRPAPPTGVAGIDLAVSAADVRVLELARLSHTDATKLAARLLGEKTKHAETIAAEGGGHPLFIHELVRHKSITPRGTMRLEDAIWTRIQELDEGPRALLMVVAVAGAPVLHEVAGRAAQLGAEAADRALAQLRVAHLVRISGEQQERAVEAYHDRVREAVFERLDEEERRVQHARIAAALEQAGDDPRMLVRHLLAAGETTRAAEHAERAAALAAEALAFDQAAEFYLTALDLGERNAADERSLRLRLADALRYSGRGPEAAEAYLAAAEGADPAMRSACRRAAAQELLVSGHVDRGLAALSAVLAESGERLPRTRWLAALSLAWHRFRLFFRGYRYRARAQDEVPAQLLERIDLYRVVARGLAFVDSLRAADYQTRGLLLCLAAGERVRVAWALLYECIFLITRGGRGRERARAIHERLVHQLDDIEDPIFGKMLRGLHGLWHYFAGDFRRAAETLAAFESATGTDAGQQIEVQTGRIFRLLALRHLGAFRELKRAFDIYLRDAVRRGDRYTEASLARALGVRWLLSDEPERLRAYLERDVWSPPAGAFHLQHWYETMARVDLALYQGGDDLRGVFRGVERSMLLSISSIKAHYFWYRGRLALAEAARGSRRARRDAARMAKKLSSAPQRSFRAFGQMMAAAVAALRGERDRAVALLSDAARGFEEQGMKLYHAVAQRRQGELLGGQAGETLVRGADELMRSEEVRNPERVADMYAPGFRPADPC